LNLFELPIANIYFDLHVIPVDSNSFKGTPGVRPRACEFYSIDVKYVDPKNKKRKKRKMKNVSSKLFTPIKKQHQDNTVTPLNYCNLLN